MSGVFNHPWLGGLFDDAEAAAIWAPERQLSHMLMFEAAFTRALGAVGTISSGVAQTTASMIEQFDTDMTDLHHGTARDGLPVPALVAQLRQAAGENAKAVHTGSTSQDVMDTALALSIREFNPILSERLNQLSGALADLSQRFGDNQIMGRTRMQAALPITVADRLSTWAQPLDLHHTRLDQLRPRVECLQLGGAVGDRAALTPNADAMAADMAARLGLTNPGKAWHAMRDGIVEYANLLSLITGTLGKMGQDISLMATQGIDEIALSGGGGSSAMPHKQNPILAELLVTLARYNATQVAGMHHALVHEHERSGAAWALEWMILPDMARTTARSLSAAAQLCQQITHIGQGR
ncbi:3-carboxy-cis,cis-muconate cycloisomerase [Roseovarius pelagicus]|uniref:3-carboxy-cis,cis-muconate cycloisomerase n=1 Tax=Roseovarius pelagicus TaxID=2980108 RepID=A0ABY6D7V4_9RHOB|nr:3-carboxy-cis,cis-muconate cycloisomerase [Roseovarius pelagicus]UXX82207.1 3-carboxy-cis,cis-muconate cycloisomerase [Roseovarius pelagicus]